MSKLFVLLMGYATQSLILVSFVFSVIIFVGLLGMAIEEMCKDEEIK